MCKLVVPNLRDENFSKNVNGWLGLIVRDTIIIITLFFCFMFVCLVAQSYSNLCNPLGCSPPEFSVHEVSQARILEWVAMPSYRGSSWPRDRTRVSRIAGRSFTTSATWDEGASLGFAPLLLILKNVGPPRWLSVREHLSFPCPRDVWFVLGPRLAAGKFCSVK